MAKIHCFRISRTEITSKKLALGSAGLSFERITATNLTEPLGYIRPSAGFNTCLRLHSAIRCFLSQILSPGHTALMNSPES